MHLLLQQRTGWFLAAWRDYRGMTLEKLAAEVETTKGQISALESGRPAQYNREWVEKFSLALKCDPHELIGVNPFLRAQQEAKRREEVAKLADELVEKARN